MSYATEIAADLAEIASDMGTTCTIGSDIDIACSASFLRKGTEIEVAGKVETVQLTIIVAASLITGTIANGTTRVTYKGTAYRVGLNRAAPTDTHYEIDCINLSERRGR